MAEINITLEEKIFLFRRKLDSMLATEPIGSLDVLRLSQKLDLLIADYYNSKKVM